MLTNAFFRRKFAFNVRKNKRFALAEMTCYKDFAAGPHGNMYPVVATAGDYTEAVESGHYTVTGKGMVARRFAGFFPYATYEVTVRKLDGHVGFRLMLEDACADVVFAVEDGHLVCTCGDQTLTSEVPFVPGMALSITCRRDKADVYATVDGYARYLGTVALPGFAGCDAYRRFVNGYVALLAVDGGTIVHRAGAYIDCGVSLADIRPVTYEDGTVMVEGGKVTLTASVRLQEECYQGVFTWTPGTADFDMVGAIFFDAGDGVWGNDVASALKYNRLTNQWNVWVCSFAHRHILGHAAFDGDVRYGLNVVDITLMEEKGPADPDTVFAGVEGDEDPDFLFDGEAWWMTVCRIHEGAYHYYLFKSDSGPFDGYTFVAAGLPGNETGGSLLRVDGRLYFACGSGEDYRLYTLPDMSRFDPIRRDIADGGFRGWGTIIPVVSGSRTRLHWLTFDRHGGSDYTWSYGNVYGYEAEF